MSKASKTVLTLLVVASVNGAGWSTPADEPSEMLARAEALYYEADFAKSVELLLRADELLQQQPGRLKEKTEVKLQLALGYIGLNDTERAKSNLSQLYALDADYRLDRQMFSPKVVRLADEAKSEQDELRCRSLFDEAQRHLGTGNADAVAKLIGSSQSKCPGLASLYPKAADLVFKEGLDGYKKSRMKEALQKFRTALALAPEHELAAEYVELTERKLEVDADRALIAWRKDFSGGDFAVAARDYRELVSVSSSKTIDEVRAEYRQTLSNLVDSWNQACAKDDTATMDDVRGRVNALLPEPTFGEDILANMKSCTHTTCIQMGAQLALARLRNRVDPKFPNSVIPQVKGSPITVRVKARIDQKGVLINSDLEGGNAIL